MNRIRKFIKIVLNRYFLMQLIKHQVAAGVEHTAIFHDLSKKHIKTVLDIGANRGQFALAARWFFPEARIFSFEPLLKAAEKYYKIFRGDPNVALINKAVGSINQRTKMHVSHADDSSSILEILALQNEIFPGTYEDEVQEAEVGPLSDFIDISQVEAPVLMKVDVQGYEMEVIRGCKDFLHVIDNIYIECSFVELYKKQAFASDVISFLANYGFILSGVYNMQYDRRGMAVQGDFFFERKT